MNVRGPELVQVHGFAVPYDTPALVEGGVVEIISQGAFEKMLVRQPSIAVRFDHHDGVEIARTTTIFECAFGLGFGFDLDTSRRESWAYLSDIVAGRCAAVSVEMTWSDSFRTARGDRMILEATVSHIAIVPSGAYRSARCWRADKAACLQLANWRTRDAAERWAGGYAAARRTAY